MSELVLDSLEIKGFRAFRDLRIERLGRVNLIVGKNNSGKTSLLEALRIYAKRADSQLIWGILVVREETGQVISREQDHYVTRVLNGLRSTFHGRLLDLRSFPTLSIGPLNAPAQTLHASFSWAQSSLDKSGLRTYKLVDYDDVTPLTNTSPIFVVKLGDKDVSFHPVDSFRNAADVLISSEETQPITNVFVPSSGLNSQQVSTLWAAVSLTDYESEVIRALRIIAPQVERVAIVANRLLNGDSHDVPVPYVRLTDSDAPVPLLSLGEGISRMFGLILALVNSRDGMLLIDEIESGFHYSVQADMWRLVFAVAKRLNVQVFATTHSWDCIEGFQQAAEADTQSDGILIRLNNRDGEVTTTLFSEDDLEIVTRELIEVR